MDRKGIFILVTCFALLLAWPSLTKKIWPDTGKPDAPLIGDTNAVSNASSTGTGTNAVATVISKATNAVAAITAEATQVQRKPEQLLSISDDKAEFVITSHGGGVRAVNLSQYLANSCDGEGDGQLVSINTNAPAPILSLGGGSQFNQGNQYELTKDGNQVTAVGTLANGLKVTKTFTLTGTNYLLDTSIKISNPTEAPVSVPAHEVVAGTATSANPKEDPFFKGVTWQAGEDTDKVEGRWFENRTLGCFPGTPRYQYNPEDGLEQLNWLASYNQFFAVAVIPKALENQFRVVSITEPRHGSVEHDASSIDPNFNAWLLTEKDFKDFSRLTAKLAAPADTFSDYISKNLSQETTAALTQGGDEATALVLEDINRLILSKDFFADNSYYFESTLALGEIRELKDKRIYPEDTVRLNRLLAEQSWINEMIPSIKGFQASLLHSPQVLQPGEALIYNYAVYAGPKEYKGLAQLSESLNNDLEEIMGFGGFFGFFSKILLLSMNWLHSLNIPYGWTIVVITIIIKLIFWPLTQASTRSMKRMAKIQPELQAIREKYKEDPQRLNVEMMRMMKEKKVSPLGGCLPMVIQMPIFFGFFFMIKSAIELRGASFMWACDLSVADTIFTIPGLGWLPFLGVPGEGLPINPMPILMCVTMLYQMSLTPQSPTMDPTQQKIMKFMPMMFILFLYRYSSGLTLYWTVNNILSIIQTKIVRNQDDDDDTKSPSSPSKPGAPGPKKPKSSLPPVPGSPEEKAKRKRVKGMPKR